MVKWHAVSNQSNKVMQKNLNDIDSRQRSCLNNLLENNYLQQQQEAICSNHNKRWILISRFLSSYFYSLSFESVWPNFAKFRNSSKMLNDDSKF